MPMLVSFRPAKPVWAPLARGFTLLELLLVLALLATVTAMIVPNLVKVLAAVKTSTDRADIVRLVESLPLKARKAGHEIRVAVGEPLPLLEGGQLPTGWRVTAVGPIRVSARGYCNEAAVRVVDPEGHPETWKVASPGCQVAVP